MSKRIEVRGTGSQAPYGIGEIIATYPDTKAGLKKAMRKASYWYNNARVVDAQGFSVDIDVSVVRKCDLGYCISY